MKLLTLTALLFGSVSMLPAAVILPTFDHDGITVPANDPRIGAFVYALPDTQWIAYGNDGPPPGGDNDFNDGRLYLSFNDHGQVFAVVSRGVSFLNNTWMIQGHRLDDPSENIFPVRHPGGKLDFSFLTGDGHSFAVGTRNILVEQLGGRVPEPSTLLLFAIGLGLLVLGHIPRNRY